MQIKPAKVQDMIALNNQNCIVSIPNRLMRKMRWQSDQEIELTNNSVCIVCNFSYYYKSRGWSNKIKAICHPFRNTDIFPDQSKLHLFSESDFCDPIWLDDKTLLEDKTDYEYDFFIFTIDSVQGIRCKGYYTIPFIASIAKELNMKGLILDYYPKLIRNNGKNSNGFSETLLRKTRKRIKRFDNLTIRRGWLSQEEITKLMDKCRFVIFPNTNDASPRAIPETLIRGKPILLNDNILGGWKYCNNVNGMSYDGPFEPQGFFGNEQRYYDNIKESMIAMANRENNAELIRQDYLDNYGFKNSCARMASIINKVEGHQKYKYVFYPRFKKYLKKLR